MKNKNVQTVNTEQLRNTAEQIAAWVLFHPLQQESDAKKLLHELQVHQIELEMQNAELRLSQTLTEKALEKMNAFNEMSGQYRNTDSASPSTAKIANRASLSTNKQEILAALHIITEMSHLIRNSGVTSIQAGQLDKLDKADQQLLRIFNSMQE